MKILMTGFTSRGTNGNATYDYFSNTFALKRALEIAGHEVDHRRVSLTETDLPERYAVAMVGIAATSGLSSRFKLGALHTLNAVGKRAVAFPSDGRNVSVFINSVRSSLNHPDTFLGQKLGERNNVIESELGAQQWPVMQSVLERLMAGGSWRVLVPTFSWGKAEPFATLFKSPVTLWDPTPTALSLQFPEGHERWPELGPREKAWLLPSLQDSKNWFERMPGTWPVIEIGNKRAADLGGQPFISELELIQRYRTVAGVLAFGYPKPLDASGWWRTRMIHAAIAGAVVCCEAGDRELIGGPYGWARRVMETREEDAWRATAKAQYDFFFKAAWDQARVTKTLNALLAEVTR